MHLSRSLLAGVREVPRRARVLAVFIPAVVLGLSQAPVSAAEVLSLKAAIARGLDANPGLAGVKAGAEAAAQVPSQVGTLPDPALSLKALNLPTNSFDLQQEAMTQLQVGLSQKLPFPGKLGLRRKAATFVARAARAEVDESRLRLIRDIRRTWWRLYYLDRAIESSEHNESLLRDLIEIARTKYQVGKGLQQDVLLASLELSKLFDLDIALKSQRRDTEANLNALLNRPVTEPVVLPDKVDRRLPKPAAEPDLLELAGGQRPLLVAARRRVDAARARRDLARKDFYPDFSLNAVYGVRSGRDPFRNRDRADFLTLGVSVSLPIYTGRKQARAVDQRDAELRRASLILQDALTGVQSEISGALARLRQARDQVLLLKDGIVPQARQTVDAMRAAYVVGKVDFLNLVTAQVTLNNYETRYWKVLSQAKQAEAALDAAVGRDTGPGEKK